MKIDPDKMSLQELVDVVFAKATQQGVQLRMKFIYPKPTKKKAAKKARHAA